MDPQSQDTRTRSGMHGRILNVTAMQAVVGIQQDGSMPFAPNMSAKHHHPQQALRMFCGASCGTRTREPPVYETGAPTV